MGQYANAVNAYAEDEAYVCVYGGSRRYTSWGQESYMLGVTVNKFRKDISKKAEKLIAKLEKEKIAKLQQELAKLQAKQTA